MILFDFGIIIPFKIGYHDRDFYIKFSLMEKFINLYIDEIEKQINKIERVEKNEITKSTQILMFLESKLEELKSFIVQYDFKTQEEGNSFFQGN